MVKLPQCWGGGPYIEEVCVEKSVSSMNCRKKFSLGSALLQLGVICWEQSKDVLNNYDPTFIIKIIRNDCRCWFCFEYSSQRTVYAVDLHLAGYCSVSKTRKCSKYLFYKYQLPVLEGILASHFANANKLFQLYFLIRTEKRFWCKISTEAF